MAFYKVLSVPEEQEELLGKYVGQTLQVYREHCDLSMGQSVVPLLVDNGDGYWYFPLAGLELVEETSTMAEQFAVPPVVHNKYMREIKPGVWVDVYDVLYAFVVTDPCLQHLIKKALASGQRGHKDTRQDLVDIVDSAQRAVQHYDAFNE